MGSFTRNTIPASCPLPVADLSQNCDRCRDDAHGTKTPPHSRPYLRRGSLPFPAEPAGKGWTVHPKARPPSGYDSFEAAVLRVVVLVAVFAAVFLVAVFFAAVLRVVRFLVGPLARFSASSS